MKRIVLLSLFVAILAAFVGITFALDPPHDSTNTIACSSCHTAHKALGGAITKVAGNANLCESCHIIGGPATNKPFAESDQALPSPGLPTGTNPSGSSHRWDSGASGHVMATGTNTSSGKVQSGGTFTGRYAKTYTISITAQGDAGTATFNWTAVRWSGDTGGGSGTGVLTGASIALNDGITATFTNGATSPSFKLNDSWKVYVRSDISQPLTAAMTARIFDGKIACSTCHNQHSQAATPFDPYAPTYGGAGTGAGRHFQRTDNNTGQMCVDCHSARNVGSLSSQSGNLSHPVGVTIPGTGFFQPPSSSFPLDPANNVACPTCHKPHYTATSDGTLVRGIGSFPGGNLTVLDQFSSQLYSNNNGTADWVGNWVDADDSSPLSGKVQVTAGGLLRLNGPPPTAPTNLTVLDQFSVVSYGNNNGSANWAGNWVDPEDSSPTAGKVQVTAGGEVRLNGPPGGNFTYLDQFNSQAYNGSNGTQTWTSTPWVETDSGGGGATGGNILVRTGDGTCPHGSSDNCLRVGATNTNDNIYRPANVSGATSATLTFAYSADTATGSIAIQVCQVGTCSGTPTWVTLATYNASATNQNASFNLTSYIAADMRIRFKVQSTGGRRLYVDDVQIAYTIPEASAAREVNLSGVSAATFSFNYRTDSGVVASDAVIVEASSNGGGSYTALETITGITGASSGSKSYNILSYAATNTRIRLRVSNGYSGANGYFYADNVQVAYALPSSPGVVGNICPECHTLADTANGAHFNPSTGLLWPGSQYGSLFPQITDTSKRGFCTNCHQPHGWPNALNTAQDYPKLLVERVDVSSNATNPGNLCYTCHDTDGPAVKTVMADFAKTRHHPVKDSEQVTSSMLRSVNCTDCHNPHMAQAGAYNYSATATSIRNQVSNPTKGVSGVSVNYTGLANFVAPAIGNYTAVSAATYQYQICFKCHSLYSFGANPPAGLTPIYSAGTATFTNGSATVTGSGTTWAAGMVGAWIRRTTDTTTAYKITAFASANSITISPAYAGATGSGQTYGISLQTDLAQEFSPNNRSGHPVVTGLDNYPNSTAVGSPLRKGLQTAALVAPWNTNVGSQTMMCSDCHNTDAASPAAQGPHGSAAQFMLRGANAANWPNVTVSNFATSWCANCHANSNNVHTNGNMSSLPCYNCHIVIPHGGKVSRLIADNDTMPARYAWNNTLNTNNVRSFNKKASSSYTTSDCQAGCTGTHSAAATENW